MTPLNKEVREAAGRLLAGLDLCKPHLRSTRMDEADWRDLELVARALLSQPTRTVDVEAVREALIVELDRQQGIGAGEFFVDKNTGLLDVIMDVDGYSLARAILALLTPQEGWREIALAPRDGRGLILIDQNAVTPEASSGYFWDGVWSCLEPNSKVPAHVIMWQSPTHWKYPPPPPPTASGPLA